MKSNLTSDSDVREYIYKKENNICVVCNNHEFFDEKSEEFYCPVCEQ